MTLWDSDGEGPEPPVLVVGGVFTVIGSSTISGVARWDGHTWHGFGPGLAGVRALTVWDPDGDGPEPARLVAGGTFGTVGGVALNNIAWWNGSSWQPFGSGMNGSVDALLVWDPDGDGPMAGELVAGGGFSTAGGVAANRVASWSGGAWQPLGSGLLGGSPGGDQRVAALTVWDPDGPGPAAPVLVAGGRFSSSGGVAMRNVARWDGELWQPLGGGLYNGGWDLDDVHALASWDPDGDGPAAPVLIAGGGFASTNFPSGQRNRIAMWNGTAWVSMGNGFYTQTADTALVYTLTTWDPDGPGPSPPLLIAAGTFTGISGTGQPVWRIASWNGSGWSPVGGGVGGQQVYALLPVGAGIAGAEPALIAGGDFWNAEGRPAFGLASWEGSSWTPFGTGINGTVFAVGRWVQGGDGPPTEHLILGGQFTSADGVVLNGIGKWDGVRWHPFGTGLAPQGISTNVHAFALWDPDGDGPERENLIVAGRFDSIDGVTVNNIARWDGSTWHALGGGTNASVRALAVWDPDGDGPLPPQLFAGGFFVTAGGVTVNRIARWDGSEWSPLGTGVSGSSASVQALAVWDPDGDGPAPARLIAAGQFSSAGGASATKIAAWDGATWAPLGDGLGTSSTSTSVWSLLAVDAGAPGPLAGQLFAGGEFTTSGSTTVNNIARWDGAAWRPLAAGLTGTLPRVASLTLWDPDGEGPAWPQLVAAGRFTATGSLTVHRLARWNGSVWHALGTGVPDGASVRIGTLPDANAVSTWTPAASQPPELVVGGQFRYAGGRPASNWSRWDAAPVPWIAAQPQAASPSAGETLLIAAAPALGYAELPGGLAFEWRRNGVPISDGPGGSSPGGGTVHGSAGLLTTPDFPVVLRIDTVQPSDAGEYTVVFFNACGEAVSEPAVVTVTGGPAPCPPDWNGDGLVNSADITAFLTAWLSSLQDGTLDADFNADGQVNSGDITAFLAAWLAAVQEGGC